MRSAIDISEGQLADILPMLEIAAVRIVGSEEAAPNIVRLIIEGVAVPDAPLVLCIVTKQISEGKASLDIVFQARS